MPLSTPSALPPSGGWHGRVLMLAYAIGVRSSRESWGRPSLYFLTCREPALLITFSLLTIQQARLHKLGADCHQRAAAMYQFIRLAA